MPPLPFLRIILAVLESLMISEDVSRTTAFPSCFVEDSFTQALLR
jgi:hypothetical protein